MNRLDEIRKRAEAATPGPWQARVDITEAKRHWHNIEAGRLSVVRPDSYTTTAYGGYDTCSGVWVKSEDAEFIANAREDIPYLLDEIERLRETLKMAETYLVDRGIEEKGTVGRTVVLPAIRAALKEE